MLMRFSILAIEMPNTNYIWSSEKTSVASVDQSGVATALDLGSSRISVQHQSKLI